MKQTGIKTAALLMAASLAAASLTGCGNINPDKVVESVGDTDITLGEVNFYFRYQQGVYETNYAQMMGGVDAMWSTEVSEGKTYEDSTKESTLALLEKMCLMEDHMKDYGVSLSDDEKKQILDAAAAFEKANTEEAVSVVSGDKATVERILTLMTIQKKVYDKVIAEADTNVTDEEAKQGKMQYVLFSYQKEDESGNTVDMTDDEKKNQKTVAEAFAKGAKKEKDFEAYAKKEGQTVQEATFGEDSTAPTEDLVKALFDAGVGKTTDAIQASNGFYVAKYVSDYDKDATETKKKDIIEQRQKDKFEEVYKGWEKDAKITKHEKLLKKIDVTKQGVTVKAAEDDSADGTESTDNK